MAKGEKQYVATFDSSERVLADGRVVIPGEPVTLDADALKDEHNKRLIDEGQLLEHKEQSGGGT